MSSRIFITCTFLLLAVASLPANAGLFIINDKKFDDRGDTTVDLQTGLEWLDLTITSNRSYNDVLNDISGEGGTFSLSDRWRYATMQDIKTLFSSTFAPDFNGSYYKVIDQEKQVADFIGLYSDTFVEYYGDDSNILLNPTKLNAAGRSLGFYLSDPDANQVNFAEVNDGDFVFFGLNNPFEMHLVDQFDSMELSTFYGSERQWRDYSSIQFGSWLVRDAVDVPEMKSFSILIACLSALFFIRNSKGKR